MSEVSKTNRQLKAATKTGRRKGGATVCLDSCHKLLGQIDQIKIGLVSHYGLGLNGQERLLHSALNEAEALAWQTPYPHLFFPVLAEEKVRAARRWVARQELVWHARWGKVSAA